MRCLLFTWTPSFQIVFGSCVNGEMEKFVISVVVLIGLVSDVGGNSWCYQCVSTQPGCGDVFDWRWYWSITCPRAGDKCVKIIERKGVDTIITRNCLSLLEGYRRDIPADHYEGCRPAARDVKLGHYTFNDMKELDIKRAYFDETTYCFCEFDWFCNAGQIPTVRWGLLLMMLIIALAAIFNTQ